MKPKTKPSAGKKPPAVSREVTVTFRLRYHTNPGQNIFITGNHAALGSGKLEQAVPMSYLDENFWQGSVTFKDAAPAPPFTYHYFIKETNGDLTHDWGNDKTLSPQQAETGLVTIIDSWNYSGFVENAFYTKPFKNVLLRQNAGNPKAQPTTRATHVFKVKAPVLGNGQTICLCGDDAALRHWNTQDPILMTKSADEDYFTARLDLESSRFPLTYKYGVYDTPGRKFLRFENLDFRKLGEPAAPGRQVILNDGFAVLPVDTWRGAGVAMPVFSLRSESGFGVGEFSDLKLLVDWCRKTGLKLIQVLPINDTMSTRTWRDSYPYSAISAFALHPLYLNLAPLATGTAKAWLKKMEPLRKRLNALPAVDYEAVMEQKCAFVRKIFPAQRAKTFGSPEYRAFFEANQHWLKPYAAFCYLRDRHGTAEFGQWPTNSVFTARTVESLVKRSPAIRREIELNYFIQFQLHRQLKDAVDYAHQHGVVLKGDLPIGICRNGADAWQEPELYHLDVQAGAPPDAFAAKGQNWGFPTYNWERMQAGGFSWWKQRCAQMSAYFDAFRIDHILGFFRIWSIPLEAVEGILGYFVPAIPVQDVEFEKRGIPLDRPRLLQPFITDPVLQDVFQDEQEKVKREFLKPEGAGRYRLRDGFRTQREVEKYFSALSDNEANRKLKIGLYDLISNVILFAAAGSEGRQFHFRLGMEDTSSFKHLDEPTRIQLKDLYVDYFFRRQDPFWMKEALQKLPALKRVTDMLVCGEDLGMVPACVPEVMKQLGLLSLEIQRMPKDSRHDFSYPRNAPYLSVVTPATHDMSTIRGWWEEEDKTRLRKFYRDELNQPGDPPPTCEAWINRAIVIQHLESPAMWSIFQWQDLLGMSDSLRRAEAAAERINVPAIPQYYWRYRMHLTLEKLNRCTDFNRELQEYVKMSGR